MRRNETEEQERARLIDEIISRDDIGYHAESAHVQNHRKTLEGSTLEHLREIVRVHTEKPDDKKVPC